jgi:rRNA biogenesis protein RRP5
MKILGQVALIQPYALIISLPNQLFGHVPITNISSQFTRALEKEDNSEPETEDDDMDLEEPQATSDLLGIFHEGQFVRTVVTAVHSSGSNDNKLLGKSRDELAKSSRRVELSLEPGRLNAGVQSSDLKAGFVSTTLRPPLPILLNSADPYVRSKVD